MLVRRSQVSAAVVATVAAGLLVVAPAPVSAAPATTTYACTFPELEEVDVLLTVDVTNLPGRLPVGVAVPAGTWDVRATLHLDDLTTGYLIGHTHDITARIGGFEPLLGEQPVLVDLASGVEALPVAEPLGVPMTGTNRAFTPRAGDEAVPLELPELFTLDLAREDGTPLFVVECEWWDGDLGVVGTVSVVKQSAVMTRRLVKNPVRTTRRAKVVVSVVSESGQPATGEVRVMLGSRTLATKELTDGRVTLRLPRLKAGKHRLTLTYPGSRSVEKTMRNVTLKVVRPTARTS